MECLKHRNWLVVCTSPRGEKRLTERLKSAGIEAYCPLQKTIRQWSDRKKLVTVPVFSSYIFVRVNEAERLRVLYDPLAARYVHWQGVPAVIKDEEMETLKLCLSNYSNIQVEAIDLRPGQTFEITHGPFKGETAFVSKVQGKKMCLYLPHIGYRLIADISDKQLISY